jgi:hypothetical protein
VEAIDTTIYLMNMSPLYVLVDTNPHEVWSGKKPSIAHLKVFVHDAFLHVPKEKRNKMDKKEAKCIFIGYKEGMKGNKLWDPASRRTLYSRYVVVKEVGGKSNPEEVVQTKNNPKTMQFELRNEENNLDDLTESEEEV